MTYRIRLVLAAACLALSGCGSEPAPPVAASPAPAVTAASPSPAAVATLDPRTACIRATQLVSTATTDFIGEIADHPDGSTIDRTKLANTIADMQALQPSMPEQLGQDLADLTRPLVQLQQVLETGVNQTIETGIYRSRGPGIIIACGQYTRN